MEPKQENILEKLKLDMKIALKSGEKERLGVIRMLLSELKNAQIAANKELSIQEEEKVLASYAKKRKESIEKFIEGGREDLADKEKREYDVTVSYLPKPLEMDDLKIIIRKFVDELGVSEKKDFGRVMKAVMGSVGTRAEGSVVSKIIKEMLNG